MRGQITKKIIEWLIITVTVFICVAFVLLVSGWRMLFFLETVFIVGILLWIGLWLFFKVIDERKIRMYQKTIRLLNINTVYAFHKAIGSVPCDIDMIASSYKYTVDAKSLMGILSMDLTKPVILRAYTDDLEVITQIEDILTEVGVE